MLMLSATDVAIGLAVQDGCIRLVERPSRFGGTYIAIEDGDGLIEVADDMEAANKRLKECSPERS